MAPKKPARKQVTKTSGNKSFKNPRQGAKKAKATRSAKKKQATAAKKSASPKITAKQAKPKKLMGKKAKSKTSIPKSTGQTKKTTGIPPFPKFSGKPSSTELTSTERYNIGGLFACAIERISDPDFQRLRSVLRELDLPSLEIDNLVRLSQGFTIPKLFADEIPPEKAGQIMKGLVKFASGDGAYEKQWRRDIRQVASWLGMTGPEMEKVEQRSGSKK